MLLGKQWKSIFITKKWHSIHFLLPCFTILVKYPANIRCNIYIFVLINMILLLNSPQIPIRWTLSTMHWLTLCCSYLFFIYFICTDEVWRFQGHSSSVSLLPANPVPVERNWVLSLLGHLWRRWGYSQFRKSCEQVAWCWNNNFT